MVSSLKRLLKEYKTILKAPTDGILAGPISEDNFFEWECLIRGPEDTPFEYGVFAATLSFPRDYPLNPPKMRFTTTIFHPNSAFATTPA